VDNGSTDGTREWLATCPSRVRTIRNPENLGFASACNLGARAARAPYVLFLNNDTVAHDGWWQPLVDLLDHDPRVVAVASKLLFPDGTLQHAGVMLVEDHQLPDALVARHIHHGAPGDLTDASVRRCFQALTAACLMVRAAAFAAVNGFDEGYWNGYEDVDLCLRLQSHGLLVLEPASTLTHHESKSGPQRFSKVRENVRRLHDRWLGRVEVDGIVEADGRFRWTNAARIRDLDGRAAHEALPATRVAGRVSIVILTWNQLDVTRACLESLARHTDPQHEWVFVDNGSTDGTVEVLRALAAERPNTRLIENATNLGFARGCNQGREVATGEYLLFLNNDVVVTEGWLEGMLECLNASPRTGFVGPMTNAISGRQQVDEVHYDTLAELDGFAADWRARHRHQRLAAPRVVGFCMLGRASLLDRIGGFDESFGTGNFEDDDLCLRAELAGHRNHLAGDVFIHHFGSRSFLGNGVDHAGTMRANRALHDAKWNTDDPQVLLLEALERAGTLADTGRLRDAVELCLEAVRLAPGETRADRELASLLLRAGQTDDALEVLQNLPSGPTGAAERLLAAQAHLDRGDIADAKTLLASFGDDADAPAEALHLRGRLAELEDDPTRAAAAFNAAIARDPSLGEPYTHLGAAVVATGSGTTGVRTARARLVPGTRGPRCARGLHHRGARTRIAPNRPRRHCASSTG
jgi:GT2 family glycosyltransferase